MYSYVNLPRGAKKLILRSVEYAQVLQVLLSSKGAMLSKDIQPSVNLDHRALNARLMKLRSYGLVDNYRVDTVHNYSAWFIPDGYAEPLRKCIIDVYGNDFQTVVV